MGCPAKALEKQNAGPKNFQDAKAHAGCFETEGAAPWNLDWPSPLGAILNKCREHLLSLLQFGHQFPRNYTRHGASLSRPFTSPIKKGPSKGPEPIWLMNID
jgi:hypothetical protein